MAGNMFQNPFAKTTQQTQPLNQPGGGGSGTPQPDPKGSINAPDNKQVPDPDLNKKPNGEGDDPMMDFATLWDNPPVDPKNPPKEEPTTFLPTIDPTKLAEQFGKIDFSKYASPEETAAIVAGGEGASKAHSSILNKSLHQAMLTMFNVNSRMVESGLSKAQERFLGKVPGHVKDVLVQGNLTKSSKVMSNPAFAPMIESVRQRYQEKFPKSTADQISTAVEKYMQEFVKAATGKEEEAAPDNSKKLLKGDATADWEKWIEPEVSNSL